MAITQIDNYSNMTSSTKPEVHHLLQYHHRTNKACHSHRQTTQKFSWRWRVVFEICNWTEDSYAYRYWLQLVLDRVCHFQPIPIHRFFAVNRYRCDTDTLQERTWRSVTDRSKAADAAAETNNSGGAAGRLQRGGGGCLWSVVHSHTSKSSRWGGPRVQKMCAKFLFTFMN